MPLQAPLPQLPVRPRLRSLSLGLALLPLLVWWPFAAAELVAQQQANPDFDPTVADPAYPPGEGPRVLFDEAHHNFHTADGRYEPFVRLITADGFSVSVNREPFTAASLEGHDILVIASARGAPLGSPSQAEIPFTDAEADAVRDWVRDGGGLLLITDHPPAATPPRPLAERFGITLVDAVPRDTLHFHQSHLWLVFSRGHGTLLDHPITRGRNAAERVDRVVLPAGNSLKPPPNAVEILKLPPTAMERYERPSVGDTAVNALVPAVGTSQGIALSYGAGRVLSLGEAAAWTSQIFGAGGEPTGLDEPGFQNRQFILNAMRWLGGLLPESRREFPIPDPGFEPRITDPTHAPPGPRVLFAEGHHNLHTLEGRLRPLAALLAADGYRPESLPGRLSTAGLAAGDVLVVAGPRGAGVACETALFWLGPDDCPAAESAFTSAEVAEVEAWVRGGGALLVALDPFPSAPAGRDLARAFEVDVGGGFVVDWVHTAGSGAAWITFDADSGAVARHPVTRGVSRAVAFGTTSLSVPPHGVGVLTFLSPAVEHLPARVFPDSVHTRFRMDLPDRAAAVALPWGQGRVVVLGDGDLLTPQVMEEGEEPVGLDGPPGHHNRRLVRNLFHWLSAGTREDGGKER
jgi:hypothetical protein